MLEPEVPANEVAAPALTRHTPIDGNDTTSRASRRAASTTPARRALLEWGKIAGERAGTNGAINRDYKATHGGAPTKGVPIR